jgi:DnaJ-class molecular chaperone
MTEECTCTRCGTCRGSGIVERADWTAPDGRELVSCDDCEGSGITEECDYCQWQRDLDEEQL